MKCLRCRLETEVNEGGWCMTCDNEIHPAMPKKFKKAPKLPAPRPEDIQDQLEGKPAPKRVRTRTPAQKLARKKAAAKK